MFAALAVLDILEFYKHQGIKIHTMGLGALGVCGTLIVSAGTKGLRKAAKHSRFSLYCGPETVDFSIEINEQMRSREIEKIKSVCIDLLAEYSGVDRDEWRTRTASLDYVDAEKARELGLFDEIG